VDDSPELPHLDGQILKEQDRFRGIGLTDEIWGTVASSIHAEIVDLGEVVHNRVRVSKAISPEEYLSEMWAFQKWMDIARENAENPVVVRAQVMTELYVSFVWLRDSLMLSISDEVQPASIVAKVLEFLRTGERRRLRNAIAHGRWRYLADFSGLECWDGRPSVRFDVGSGDLGAWQMLSRGTSISILLALTGE